MKSGPFPLLDLARKWFQDLQPWSTIPASFSLQSCLSASGPSQAKEQFSPLGPGGLESLEQEDLGKVGGGEGRETPFTWKRLPVSHPSLTGEVYNFALFIHPPPRVCCVCRGVCVCSVVEGTRRGKEEVLGLSGTGSQGCWVTDSDPTTRNILKKRKMDKFLVKGNVLTPVIPVLRILRQEEHKLKSSRIYTE